MAASLGLVSASKSSNICWVFMAASLGLVSASKSSNICWVFVAASLGLVSASKNIYTGSLWQHRWGW